MAEPIRVLIVGYGGGEITFLNRLVRGLAEAGLDLAVTSPKITDRSLLEGTSIHQLKTPNWEGPVIARLIRLTGMLISRFSTHRLGWLWRQVRAGRGLGDRLRLLNRYLPFLRGRWDLVYFPWNSAAIGYRGLYELGLPVVVSCRGSQVNIRPHLPGQEGYAAALQRTLQQAAAVHCVSMAIQHTVVGMGVDPNQCRLIRPAVDPGFFTPPQQPPHNSHFKLITTGALVWPKSYETLLVALKHLVDSGVEAELHIIGEGPERERILYTLHDLNLVDRVVLHGRLCPAEVRDHLQKADCFVLASLSEGIANAALEAMSCGLPVVTTDCGGMREAVTNGVEGFLVPPRDPQALASALAKLAHEPVLRQQMSAAGRSRIIKQFCLDDQITAFINLFQFKN